MFTLKFHCDLFIVIPGLGHRFKTPKKFYNEDHLFGPQIYEENCSFFQAQAMAATLPSIFLCQTKKEEKEVNKLSKKTSI